MTTNKLNLPEIVTRKEWLNKRKKLLNEEKELTRLRDRLNAKRRRLPMVRVGKEYEFDTPDGKKTLAELFDGRSQLIVRHFMFGPDWDEGCHGCSFASDHVDGALPHLTHRDVTYVAVSRAPISKIGPFKKRMGWRFPWVSSHGSDFNFDFHVSFTKEDIESGLINYNYKKQEAHSSEMGGISVFYKDENGKVFHTYSTFARGDEMLDGTLMYLDLTPLGRQEYWEQPAGRANSKASAWWRHHDKYED